MNKVITLFVVIFVFVLGGCSTFRGLKEDAKLAAYKMKGMFSKGKDFTASQQQVRKTQQLLRAEGYHPGRPRRYHGPTDRFRPEKVSIRQWFNGHGTCG